MKVFHSGEVEVQQRAGVRDLVARVGPRMVRDHLLEEHREFFPLLTFLVLASRNGEGAPVASLISGPQGFARAVDERLLRIESPDLAGLALAPSADIGLLGLQPETRRRNRANGVVLESTARSTLVRVEQSYGNCPQHITVRTVMFRPREDTTLDLPGARASVASSELDDEMTRLMSRADTFFIATGAGCSGGDAPLGLDASHRGGPPGFVSVDQKARELRFPDYPGNNMFNTLGNLQKDSRAGLAFVDFETSRVLQVQGTARVDWSDRAKPNEPLRWVIVHAKQARWIDGLALQFGAAP